MTAVAALDNTRTKTGRGKNKDDDNEDRDEPDTIEDKEIIAYKNLHRMYKVQPCRSQSSASNVAAQMDTDQGRFKFFTKQFKEQNTAIKGVVATAECFMFSLEANVSSLYGTTNPSGGSRSVVVQHSTVHGMNKSEFGDTETIGHCKVFLEWEHVGQTLDLSALGLYEVLYRKLL